MDRSSVALVDSEDVARGAPHDVLRNAPLDESFEEAFFRIPTTMRSAFALASATMAFAGSPSGHELGLEPTFSQERPCLAELRAAVVGHALLGLAVGGDDVRDDQRGVQALGQVGRPRDACGCRGRRRRRWSARRSSRKRRRFG